MVVIAGDARTTALSRLRANEESPSCPWGGARGPLDPATAFARGVAERSSSHVPGALRAAW